MSNINKHVDLVSGKILKTLVALTLPVLGTSLIQMAYNLVNMMWVGRVGSSAVAAIGTAGFFPWLSAALVYISKVGVEVGVSQSIGKGELKERDKYIVNSIIINICVSVTFTIVVIVFRKAFIGFFNLGDKEVVEMASNYLAVIVLGTIFTSANAIFTSIFMASGNSRFPFYINTISLAINFILDPLLIFGVGQFNGLGVNGAAIATIVSQIIANILFIKAYVEGGNIKGVKALKCIDFTTAKKVMRLGIAPCIENGGFIIFSMIIGRLVAGFGPTTVAVQKVGSQIEDISWMTASGFSTALTTFIGQNYGAKKFDRIHRGYRVTIGIAMFVGLIASIILIGFGGPVFSIFIPENDAIKGGIEYLRILGYSQIFMCIEITTAGAFRGLGKTILPSLISITFTGLRIPMALLLSKTSLGVNGVWWSISISSIIKGTLLIILFIYISRKYREKVNEANLIS